MIKETGNNKEIWILIPLFGALIFFVLYIIGSYLYPGGSQIDKHSIGFSWMNNYWCNLLDKFAVNGKLNPARPVALSGMVILCVSIAFFWVLFPQYISAGKSNKLLIQFSGSLSMSIAIFVFTDMHDNIINTAGILGIVTIICSLIGLYKMKWFGLMIMGSLNLVLLFLNNYIYQIKDLLIFLPMVQKISFVSYLTWISIIDLKLYYREKSIKLSH